MEIISGACPLKHEKATIEIIHFAVLGHMNKWNVCIRYTIWRVYMYTYTCIIIIQRHIEGIYIIYYRYHAIWVCVCVRLAYQGILKMCW